MSGGLLLLWVGGGAPPAPSPSFGNNRDNLLSKLSPPNQRVWDTEGWRWLEEQIEIAKQELEGKNSLAYSDSSADANAATASEQTLKGYNFAEGVIDVKTPQLLRVRANGTAAANTNSKRIRIYINSTLVADTGAWTTASGILWDVEAEVLLLSQSSAVSKVIAHIASLTPVMERRTVSEQFFDELFTVEVRALIPGGAADEVTCDGFTIDLVRQETVT